MQRSYLHVRPPRCRDWDGEGQAKTSPSGTHPVLGAPDLP
ncbi:hypothetical protein RC1_3025 [Rhodospirillum centenum SW]|uniref:Uncharacterized protein n=1 Tax=Rhodospirillum centenum (strain ATCC 51521 / SW) TaxID=414684 RepID=B6IVR8_RHOCS|nr:hypothetical protein RC1_3025 [Rhodospirillum centenum SW]